MSENDMGTCPLPVLIDQFKESGEKALDDNDFLRGMVYHIVANRFKELLGVLRLCKDEDVYHAWQEHNGKTEAEVREMLDGMG